MDDRERLALWEEWLGTRPECVQRLAREFPPGSVFTVEGRTLHLCGYNEDDMLIVSAVDPGVDFDAALLAKEYVCAEHFRWPGGSC